MASAPVHEIPTDPDDRKLENGMALCLSGGGYRAMVFHVGVLWRLYETGLLAQLQRISSVSGGSITAAVLALKWKELTAQPGRPRDAFEHHIVAAIRGLADETIDREAIALGILLPGRISDRVAKAYDDRLFHGATLQDLPDRPRFVINATNVQSGALWRFSKEYMADWRVGVYNKPAVELAVAVGASSAFPPVLSPVRLSVDLAGYAPDGQGELFRPPFTTD